MLTAELGSGCSVAARSSVSTPALHHMQVAVALQRKLESTEKAKMLCSCHERLTHVYTHAHTHTRDLYVNVRV